jgi:hypothetical protein
MTGTRAPVEPVSFEVFDGMLCAPARYFRAEVALYAGPYQAVANDDDDWGL